MASSDPTIRLQRLPQMMLFAGFAVWYFGAGALATSAANGLAFRFRLVAGRGMLEACFHLFLLVVGFVVLQGIARQRLGLEELTALPRRATAGREWLVGSGGGVGDGGYGASAGGVAGATSCAGGLWDGPVAGLSVNAGDAGDCGVGA